MESMPLAQAASRQSHVQGGSIPLALNLEPDARPAALRLARRYIWWELPEKSLENLPRFLAHCMNLATWQDQLWLEEHFSCDDFRAVLQDAPAGIFSPKSWNYWHVRLGLSAPPPPRKHIPT
jgi:hypothetical protein